MTWETKPVDVLRLVLYDDQGCRYVVEHAGAWDSPPIEQWPEDQSYRSGCYYEDDVIPKGAISLYRVSRDTAQSGGAS